MKSDTVNISLCYPCYACENNQYSDREYPCKFCVEMPMHEEFDEKTGNYFAPIQAPSGAINSED